jgi:hypothetical protein
MNLFRLFAKHNKEDWHIVNITKADLHPGDVVIVGIRGMISEAMRAHLNKTFDETFPAGVKHLLINSDAIDIGVLHDCAER